MDTSDIMAQLTIKDKLLVVVYDKLQYGLFRYFSTDEDMKKFITEHIDEAFQRAVWKKEAEPYMLNIASTKNFSRFSWSGEKHFLDCQLHIFMPLIRKFITDAKTDTLEVLDYDELIQRIKTIRNR